MAKKKQNMIPLISGSVVVVFILIWLAMPVIAGIFKIGDPDGPKIYPREMHISLFKMGHTAAGHGSTPVNFYKEWLYERPWFYGMERKLITQSQAQEAWKNTKEWIHRKTE